MVPEPENNHSHSQSQVQRLEAKSTEAEEGELMEKGLKGTQQSSANICHIP